MFLKEAGIPLILDEAAQNGEIRDVTTPARYFEFISEHFQERTSPYLLIFDETVDQLPVELPPDYYRFKAAIGMSAGQFGFESINGHLLRHAKYKWRKSPFSPLHELELGRYIATLNLESHKVKQSLSSRFYEENLPASLGVWGVPLGIEECHIKERRSVGDIKDAAALRFSDPRPICLATPDVNAALATVDISAEVTERGRSTFPEAERIFQGVCDMREVFSPFVFETFERLPDFNQPLTRLLLPPSQSAKVA